MGGQWQNTVAMAEHLLILVRHGKSDWSGQHADRDRPLANRGRRQAPESGRWLAEHGPAIDQVVCSPAVRARSTWELMAAELSGAPELRVDDRLYSWLSDDLLDVVRGLPESAEVVALVGHNPGLEELCERLTGRWVRLPTSAVAVLTLPGAWSEAALVKGTVVAAGRPPEDPDPGTPSR